MYQSIERKICSGFAIALLLLACIGGLACWSTKELVSTAIWVEHTHQVLQELGNLQSQLSSAELGQRDFIITSNQQYLDSYYLNTSTLNRQVNTIRELTADNPNQQQRIQALESLLKKRLMLLQQTLNIRRLKGFELAQQRIEQDVGRSGNDQIRQIINAMVAEENRLLQIRSDRAKFTANITMLVVGCGGILSFGLIPLASAAINRYIRRQQLVETNLVRSEKKLKLWVGQLEQRNHEISLLAQLSDVLQACFTLEEAYTALSELVSPLFPNTSGGVSIISESRTLVEPVATWGDDHTVLNLFTPTQCWALRRGQPYFLNDVQSHLHCQHLHPPLKGETLCVPLMAQGEALGVLHLIAFEAGQLTSTKQLLANTVGEHIAIALANLKLRETLKNQSIRDPLTSLFNRRYMEESLEREVKRTERKEQSLGLIMLDIDHFKQFNDTYGHEAGDIVLRELGQFLKSIVRGSDIACRYGGEEFMLLLPEASLQITQLRAEQIRIGTKHLNLQYRRQPLGAVTLSLGVASFPQHGNSVETLIRAADTALYQAKKAGRDQVVVAQPSISDQTITSMLNQ